jgi:hypothetical protein
MNYRCGVTTAPSAMNKRLVVLVTWLIMTAVTSRTFGLSATPETTSERAAAQGKVLSESEVIIKATAKFLEAKRPYSRDFRVVVTEDPDGWRIGYFATLKHPGWFAFVFVSKDGRRVELTEGE